MRFHDPQLAAQRRPMLDQLIRQMRQSFRWEEQPCVACGEADAQQLPQRLEKWGIAMRQCSGCGHLFTSPRMEERGVPDLYGSFYWEQYQVAIGSPNIEERLRFDYDNGQFKLERDVLPYRSRGRLLEIGASSGGLVKRAQECGFVAAGLEPSDEICQLARRAHGIDMFSGVLAEQQFDDGSWDIVVLHDVLEHMFEPVRELEEMIRVLAPGGLLAIETPTTSSLNFADQDTAWSTISPLEHVHLFHEGTIEQLATSRGLRVLDLYCPHEDNWVLVAEKP